MPVATVDRQRTRLAGAVTLWSAGAFALWLGARVVCPEGACGAPALDRNVLDSMHALRRPWLDTVMAAATWLGSIVVLAPCAALLAWSRWRANRRGDALLLLTGLGGAWLVAHAAKLFVARPRPDFHEALVAMPADLAYPSAHTMQVTAFALAWLLASRSRSRAAVVVAIVAIVVVATSRLYLQVHFPSDVIAALAAGAAWVAGLRLFLDSRS
ncbi:MAG: phosphatase PAP2 family protein [Burkholderiales bacterium]